MGDTALLNFEYEVLEHLPGYAEDIIYIPKQGPGVGRDGMIIQFSLPQNIYWIGMFAFGELNNRNSLNVFPGPGKDKLSIVSRGEAYIVTAKDSASFVHVGLGPVYGSMPIPQMNLSIFYDSTQVVAYDEQGLAWATNRISWDGLRKVSYNGTSIIGEAWDSPEDAWVIFVIDPSDGSHTGVASCL